MRFTRVYWPRPLILISYCCRRFDDGRAPVVRSAYGQDMTVIRQQSPRVFLFSLSARAYLCPSRKLVCRDADLFLNYPVDVNSISIWFLYSDTVFSTRTYRPVPVRPIS